MDVTALAVGLLVAALCYLSLVESAGRGSVAAVALYRRRAVVTAAAAGAVSMGLVGAIQAIG